jgi:hypothetical protein
MSNLAPAMDRLNGGAARRVVVEFAVPVVWLNRPAPSEHACVCKSLLQSSDANDP